MRMNVNAFSLLYHKLLVISLILLMSLSVVHPAATQKAVLPEALQARTLQGPDVSRVISEFTTSEAEFRRAFNQYGYKRELIIQTVRDGKVTGEYHRISQIVLGKDGSLEEKVLSFPLPSLTEITVTSEDLEDLGDKYQFTLEAAQANKYKFTYAGNERMENQDFYIFDVKPLSLSSKERLFQGRVWVSVQGLKIVKMRGKGEQKGGQRFPVMEMHRTAVDSRYLFPVYSFADQDITFADGLSAHLRISVRYTDYVKLR